ncbi:hypothetical protein Q8A73_001385 [Channa argus]|nr:hypothetical protein Q8A73_001385 [Channa argus]
MKSNESRYRGTSSPVGNTWSHIPGKMTQNNGVGRGLHDLVSSAWLTQADFLERAWAQKKEEDKELAHASSVWTECSYFLQSRAQHVRRCLLEVVLVPRQRERRNVWETEMLERQRDVGGAECSRAIVMSHLLQANRRQRKACMCHTLKRRESKKKMFVVFATRGRYCTLVVSVKRAGIFQQQFQDPNLS